MNQGILSEYNFPCASSYKTIDDKNGIIYEYKWHKISFLSQSTDNYVYDYIKRPGKMTYFSNKDDAITELKKIFELL